jgi:hypothetical protein
MRRSWRWGKQKSTVGRVIPRVQDSLSFPLDVVVVKDEQDKAVLMELRS